MIGLILLLVLDLYNNLDLLQSDYIRVDIFQGNGITYIRRTSNRTAFPGYQVDYGSMSRDLRIKDTAFRRNVSGEYFEGIYNGFGR